MSLKILQAALSLTVLKWEKHPFFIPSIHLCFKKLALPPMINALYNVYVDLAILDGCRQINSPFPQPECWLSSQKHRCGRWESNSFCSN